MRQDRRNFTDPLSIKEKERQTDKEEEESSTASRNAISCANIEKRKGMKKHNDCSGYPDVPEPRHHPPHTT